MQNSNLFWAGLATLAAKRFDRDLLVVGTYELAYRISDAAKNVEKVSGVLTVSPGQVRSSTSKPPLEDLVSALLYRLNAKKRGEVVELIASQGLVADEATKRLARELISLLSVTSTSTVRGSLVFGTH
jgi:hypothetical protein